MSAEFKNQKLLFVTGRLAEAGLREVLAELAPKLGFRFQVCVPGVQVAALMHVRLLLKRLSVDADVDRIILPGWVQGDLQPLLERFGRPVERGPKDYRDLPEYFGLGARRPVSLTDYSVQILGEINHATRRPVADVVAEARQLSAAGADLIDVGCVPGETSEHVGEIVGTLVAENLRVSVDSFDRREVEQAVAAGAELILSCNHSNLDWVSRLGVEVVAIPDAPSSVDSLDRLIEQLSAVGCPFRIDPILEPIALGFTKSLRRYMDFRERYPELPMMMGVGNVTELTEVDSAGVNMLLAAICEELAITSILTTQVINWCRTAVAEFDAARRQLHYAVSKGVIPKHLDSSLVMLRDARPRSLSTEALQQLAESLTDANFRIFANDAGLHLMNGRGHWTGESPFPVFESAVRENPDVDAGHAFYLGYEMARAEVARLLGREYTQDEPMNWGVAGTLPGSAAIHHDRASADRRPSPPDDSTPNR